MLPIINNHRNTCTAGYIELQQISSICQYFTVDATKTLISPFVLSRLDYCNALLSGVPQYLLGRLQRVQNAAARQTELPKQTILLPFCTHSIGCQWQLEFSTKYPSSVTVLCQIPFLNTCPGSCGFIHHRDNSVRPLTTALFVFSPSKQKLLSKILFICWSCNLEQSSIRHQDFRVKNLIQVSPQNPSV